MLIYLQMIENQEDKNKFAVLYRAYRNLMLHIAYQILENQTDAEDAVHEACLCIVEIIDKIHDPKCPKTRLLVGIITRGKAVDLYRARKRRDADCLEDVELAVDGENPARTSELADPVLRAMDQLPQRQRDLLLLKYDQGFDNREIARMMDMSQANVEKTLQRAKARLKQNLEEMGVEV